MRHIPLDKLLENIFTGADGETVKLRLENAHKKLIKMPPETRSAHIRRNGPNKWKPVKNRLADQLGKLCWYTEVELIGSALVIDHYRPVCNYWWLAYDAENYRVACPWANSPEHNALHGSAGGKGDNFPLLPPAEIATQKDQVLKENPLILDPCNEIDCKLLAFQVDGRPILNPNFANDAVAEYRVDKSVILLNIDHPDFNSKREQLCNSIREDVEIHEDLTADSPKRVLIRNRLQDRLAASSEFSTAARFYLQLHRDLDWVEDILRA